MLLIFWTKIVKNILIMHQAPPPGFISSMIHICESSKENYLLPATKHLLTSVFVFQTAPST